jgi:alpha-L-fucosidase 2
MKKRLIIFNFICIFAVSSYSQEFYGKKPFWYAAPAVDWKSAIPIGNGRMGGLVFGDPVKDQIVINENSIWCGLPVSPNNLRGPQLIKQMRRLLFAGEYIKADSICKHEFLDGVHENARSYQPFGFLEMEFAGNGEISDYKRWLDYENAVTFMTYKQNGVTYTREAFVSAPDQVMVMHLSADKSGKLSFTSRFTRPFGATAKVEKGNSLHISGRAYAENGEFQGVNFDGIIRFITDGGKVKSSGNSIQIENAGSVTILIAINTDYNLQEPYRSLTHNRKSFCEKQLLQAVQKGFTRLKQVHVNDYTALYSRSALDINFNIQSNTKPIDERIAMVAAGHKDPELLLEYYRYCRYLLISSSRKGGLPMNLQGIWNPLMLPPWRSNFHININLQEAYWFAEQANLPDCHEPLFTFTEKLVENGKETAQKMLGVKRGFVAGHRTDAWFYTGMTAVEPCHGMYVVSNSWLAQHLMEHYRFTKDKNFLQTRAYPLIREAALFFVDWLVPDPRSGKLVSGPSASSENRFLIGQARVGLTMGSSQDQEMIWNTFRDYLEVCGILGISSEETEEVQNALKNLALPKIGSDGRLMEWSEELKESEPGHRHLSHLWNDARRQNHLGKHTLFGRSSKKIA